MPNLVPKSVMQQRTNPVFTSQSRSSASAGTWDPIEELRRQAILSAARSGVQPYAWRLRLLGDLMARMFIVGDRCVVVRG